MFARRHLLLLRRRAAAKAVKEEVFAAAAGVKRSRRNAPDQLSVGIYYYIGCKDYGPESPIRPKKHNATLHTHGRTRVCACI